MKTKILTVIVLVLSLIVIGCSSKPITNRTWDETSLSSQSNNTWITSAWSTSPSNNGTLLGLSENNTYTIYIDKSQIIGITDNGTTLKIKIKGKLW